jgi:acyl transferase domain-containing protein/acyl carrier protein
MSSPESVEPAGEIAIVGMAGRFPGARSLDEFWRNLRDGVESISFYPEDEPRPASNHEQPPGGRVVRAGAPLFDPELFDASFFGFTPREAEIADPQQRLFLECAWEALEAGGYSPEQFDGRIGVYAGASASNYFMRVSSDADIKASAGAFQIEIGNDKDYLATRVSYKLNLRGPSLTIQTACSTSLVAVHVACQALLDYECDMALAGGVSVRQTRGQGYVYQAGGIMSPDGRCRAFDARAEGTVGGDGLGVVLLKRLQDALDDGDTVLAVIKGSAVNNDGSLKVGFTAPSVDGQAEVIARALANAGAGPETISYVEAHGTATPLGDTIEIAALNKAFLDGACRSGSCAVGSLKTNIGHLNTAAGVAGLIKTVLALGHRQIPPSLHFESPNPKIEFSRGPFYVNAQLANWHANGTPRRAGVSSFGIGGTNAHVIVEEAPRPAATTRGPRPLHLLTLSARTEAALKKMTASLLSYLKATPDADLADVAYTLHVGRSAFKHRRFLVCRDVEDAVSALEAPDAGRVETGFAERRERPVAFMFTGQGAQHTHMARELYEAEEVFRAEVDRAAECLRASLGFDLREVLCPTEASAPEASQRLEQTSLAQPALFVVEYALAKMWGAWGVRPQAFVGHSLGEYTAACLSGVLSWEDALSLVALRGRLMQRQPGGLMLAVALGEEDVAPLLKNGLALAAVNGPSLCVVSGPTEAVEELERFLAARGDGSRRLHTSHAFHSGMMEPVLGEFTEHVRRLDLRPPSITFVSNLTGTWVTDEEVTDPAYWGRHLRGTVRLSDGLAELLKEPARVLLEVGPGHTLSTLARQHPRRTSQQVVLHSLPAPDDTRSDYAAVLETLGRLWMSGCAVDWAAFHSGERRRRIPLPTYPFERERFWVEYDGSAADVRRDDTDTRRDVADWFYVPLWKESLRADRVEPDRQDARGARWLVFAGADELSRQVVERLMPTAADIVRLVAGDEFARLGENEYAIRPRLLEDYTRVLGELRQEGRMPERVLHLWCAGAAPEGRDGLEAFEETFADGYGSLLFLAQALGNLNLTHRLHLDVVSSNMHQVTGEEPPCPEKAILLGLCKVIPKEFPNASCRSIDVAASGQTGCVAGRLLAELSARPATEVIALRGARRWTQTFEAVRLDGGARPRLRQEGVYMLTGAFGGIGLAVAEHLARTLQAKLILISNSFFPPPGEWEQWLGSHAEPDCISSVIRKLRAFEDAGAEVLALSADVADFEKMRAAVGAARARFGKIDGVFHAEETPDAGLLQQRTPEMSARVLNPKVRGTFALASALKDEPPDFMALFSSATSSLAGIGQADECAASSFLDAYAEAARARPDTFTIAINWPAWRDDEAQPSTAATLAPMQEQMRQLRQTFGLTFQEGVEALSRILSSSLPRVVVATRDFKSLVERQDAVTVASVLEELERLKSSGPAHARPALDNDYCAPRNAVEDILVNIWQEAFGIQRVGVHDRFLELGGHSLLAVQLITRVRATFQIELPLQALFDAQTVAELARRIMEQQLTPDEIDEIEQLYREIGDLPSDEVKQQLAEGLSQLEA